MQYLKQYKKLLHISCLSVPDGKNQNFSFQIRFEQIKPHSVFKYELTKHKQEVKQLYHILDQDIFDFENPFGSNVFSSFVKNAANVKNDLNASLALCRERIDVITHLAFVQFFCLQLHYEDFSGSLRQAETIPPKVPQKEQKEPPSKSSKRSEFDRCMELAYCLQHCQIQLMPDTDILDFTHVRYYQNEVLYILEQPKKTAKIKNFFKNVFNQQSSQLGFISIHRREQSRFQKISEVELPAQPLFMDFIEKTNMILVTSAVGVYIYLAKMETKLQEIQIFSYVELQGCVGCCNNSMKAELYLLCQVQTGQLHVYSINQQKLMKTQHKYHNPSALCFEDHHSRLYVSDNQGIHIYSVIEYLQIKKLHMVMLDSSFRKLTINHGYLLAISEKGFMTVLELKPPTKEQLISVTTNIGLPENSIHVVGSSENRRLLVTHYRNNLVLIDTIQGPLFSFRLKGGLPIQSVFSNRGQGTVLALAIDGHLSVIKLGEAIK